MLPSQLLDVLFENQDLTYRQMQIKLLPNLSPDSIIGVRTPILRSIARQLEDASVFCENLPHRFFEESQIHSFLLEREKNFDVAISGIEGFLPFVNNWATCDQLRPRCFQRNRQKLLPYIQKWIASDEPYTIRFGMGMLMCHFMDEEFEESLLELPAGVQSKEYYVQMMVAWFYATALAKQYEAALPYISGYRLDQWTHNKTVQKATESYRVSPEHKRELIGYRLK